MRKTLDGELEAARILTGPYASDASYGPSGAFLIRGPRSKVLRIVASDGSEWEHVSVSTDTRVPRWQEMCFVKDLFWYDDETVIQFHPARSEYVNCHPYCLHLWRPPYPIPLPPSIFVGPKNAIR